MTRLTQEDIERAWRSTRDAATDELLERLRDDPDRAEELLAEVADSRRRDVRIWVTWLARKSLPPEKAVPIIQRVAESRSPDIRDSAIQELLELDPAAAKPFIPALRRDLKPKPGYWDPRFAIWTLAQLGVEEVAPEVEAVATHFPEQHLAAQSARLAALVLRRDFAAIEARVAAGGPEDVEFIEKAAEIVAGVS